GPLDVRGWKLYCGWGDPGLGKLGGEGPTHNGWWFDDENGMAIVEHIRRIQAKTNRPPVVCTHKGLAFNGTFDSAKFSPRDMGVIGAQFPDLTFFTYHSGYDGEHQTAYPGDEKVNSSNRGVDSFIKSLRENGIDATKFVPPGLEHGNTPNMFAHPNISDWPVDAKAHPERTIRNGIFGRTAAAVYGLDPDAKRNALSCDEVQKMRDAYILNPGTPKETAPLRSNTINGPRTK